MIPTSSSLGRRMREAEGCGPEKPFFFLGGVGCGANLEANPLEKRESTKQPYHREGFLVHDRSRGEDVEMML